MLDLAVVDRLLTTTRAVRRKLDLTRPVDPQLVEECLELALQAPTGGNRQGWRWLIVTRPELRAGLADIYRSAEDGVFGRRAEESRESRNDRAVRVYTSAGHLAATLDRVPVHVVPCIEGRLESTSAFEASTLYGSILPAVWSFALALRSRGLGSCWTTIHLKREREAAELLGIPDGFTQVGLIPVAYALSGAFKPAQRAGVSEVTFRDRWP